MNPKIKDKLMQDFWGKKWIDLSVIIWMWKKPKQDEWIAMEQEDDMTMPAPTLDGQMSPSDMLFQKMKPEVDMLWESDILKLIHMISMSRPMETME